MTTIDRAEVELSLDSSALREGLSSAQRSLRDFGGKMKAIGQSMTTGITLPVAGAFTAILKVAGDFESKMKVLARTMGTETAGELKKLNDIALEWGKNSVFSANEVADAMIEISRATDVTVEEMESVLPTILQLATAAEMPIAQAAETILGIKNAYGIAIDGLEHANNVILETANKTAAGVDDLGTAFSFVGPLAEQTGNALEDTAAAIGVLSDNSIKGTRAGTALRGMLEAILNPTKEQASAFEALGIKLRDSQGNVRPLLQIMGDLSGKTQNAELFMTAFGTVAGSAAIALAKQAGEAKTLAERLRSVGSVAAEIAATKMEGFVGSFEELKGSIETLMITIGNSGVLDFATKIAKGLKELVEAISEADPKLLQFGATFAAIMAAAGPLIAVLGFVVAGLLSFGAPVLIAVAAIASLVAAWITYGEEIKQVGREVTANFNQFMLNLRDWANDNRETVKEVGDNWDQFTANVRSRVQDFRNNMSGFRAALREWADNNRATVAEAGSNWDQFTTSWKSRINEWRASLREWADANRSNVAEVSSNWDQFKTNIANRVQDFRGNMAAFRASLRGWASNNRATVDEIIGYFTGFGSKIAATVEAAYKSIKTWLVDKLESIGAGIKSKVDGWLEPFRRFKNLLVDNSIIPDTVKASLEWMDKLVAGMGTKAKEAAEIASKAFSEIRPIDATQGFFTGIGERFEQTRANRAWREANEQLTDNLKKLGPPTEDVTKLLSDQTVVTEKNTAATKVKSQADLEAEQAARSRAKAYREFLEQLQFETAQLTLSDREQFINNQLRSAGKELTAAQGLEVRNLAGNYFDLEKAVSKAKEEEQKLQEQRQKKIDLTTNVTREIDNIRRLTVARLEGQEAYDAMLNRIELENQLLRDKISMTPAEFARMEGLNALRREEAEHLADIEREAEFRDKLTTNLNREISNMQRLTAARMQGKEAYDKMLAQLELENQLIQQKIKTAPEEFAREKKLIELRDEAAKRQEEVNRAMEGYAAAGKRIAEDFTRNMIDGLIGVAEGTEKLGNVFKNTLSSMARMVAQQLMWQTLSPLTQGIGFGLASLFGGFGRAGGGRVSVGTPYVVGERKPELFVPDQPGKIVPSLPNSPGGGQIAPQVNVNLNVMTGVQQTVRAELVAMLPEIKRQTTSGVMDAVRQGGSAARTLGRF